MNKRGWSPEDWGFGIVCGLIALYLWWTDASQVAWLYFLWFFAFFGLTQSIQRIEERLTSLSTGRIETKRLDIVGSDGNTKISLRTEEGRPVLEMTETDAMTYEAPYILLGTNRNGPFLTLEYSRNQTLQVSTKSDGTVSLALSLPKDANTESPYDELCLETTDVGARAVLRELGGFDKVLWKSA